MARGTRSIRKASSKKRRASPEERSDRGKKRARDLSPRSESEASEVEVIEVKKSQRARVATEEEDEEEQEASMREQGSGEGDTEKDDESKPTVSPEAELGEYMLTERFINY